MDQMHKFMFGLTQGTSMQFDCFDKPNVQFPACSDWLQFNLVRFSTAVVEQCDQHI